MILFIFRVLGGDFKGKSYINKIDRCSVEKVKPQEKAQEDAVLRR